MPGRAKKTVLMEQQYTGLPQTFLVLAKNIYIERRVIEEN
jgi:hypothetical protein